MKENGQTINLGLEHLFTSQNTTVISGIVLRRVGDDENIFSTIGILTLFKVFVTFFSALTHVYRLRQC